MTIWGAEVRECWHYLHLHEDAVRESYLDIVYQTWQRITIFKTALKWEYERPAVHPQEKSLW